MAGAEEPDCMWLGTDNGCISHACLSMTTTNTGSQPVVTLVISLDQSIGQNTLISGQAGLDQRSFVSHGSESTNPRASSSAKTHVLCPRVTNSSQHTASRIRQQQSGGTPVMGLKHTSNMDHSPWYDDQPEDTAEHSLGSTSAQPSPYSTALARAGRQQQMQLHPGPMSMQSQVGSANQPCRLAHDGPVHEIMVLNDRVVTRGGREQSVVMKEWTPNGELIETHSICKQGQYIIRFILLALLSCLHPVRTSFCCSLQRCRHHGKDMDSIFFSSLFGNELIANRQTHTPSSNQWCLPSMLTLHVMTLASLMSAGPITCMTALHQLPSQHKHAHQAGQKLLPDMDRGQLLTGHTSGQVKVWSAAAEQPLRPLAVLGAPTVSPVKSLVVLADQQLLCFAHADGHLALHTMPNCSVRPTWAESQNEQDLPVLSSQHVVCQAHRLGLEQCVKCEVGLMSVGSSGTILMWSEEQLSSILQQPDYLADDG